LLEFFLGDEPYAKQPSSFLPAQILDHDEHIPVIGLCGIMGGFCDNT